VVLESPGAVAIKAALAADPGDTPRGLDRSFQIVVVVDVRVHDIVSVARDSVSVVVVAVLLLLLLLLLVAVEIVVTVEVVVAVVDVVVGAGGNTA